MISVVKKITIGFRLYASTHYSSNTKYPNVKIPSNEFGITAPLGIALNWGHFLGAGSFTIYGGIIDIGAIFTYKINSDSSVNSDIRLSQIFSPSIGFVYGFPIINKTYNLPFSLGINYQLGPKLKKVNQTESSVLPLLAGRFNVFLAVDIPVINFHVSK